MVPRRNWSGADEDGLLGCSIRFTLFDTVIDIVWHVLVRFRWNSKMDVSECMGC